MALALRSLKLSKLRVLQLTLAVAILGFVCSAVYISGLLLQRQSALSSVGRGNVTWQIAQSPSEFARFQQRISEYGMAGRAVDAAEVKLRFDIVVNRLRTLKSGSVAKFMAADPENTEMVSELDRTIRAARPLVDQLSVPGTPEKLLDLLAPIYPRLTRLSVNANVWNGARLNEERQGLFNLQWMFAGVAAGLIICGVIFVVLLLLHNRLLVRSQETLRRQEIALNTQNKRFNAALNNMSQGLCLIDAEQRVIDCNSRFLRLFNLETVRAGVPLGELIPLRMLPVAAPLSDDRWTGGTNVELAAASSLSDGTYRMDNGSVLYASHQPMDEGGWVSTFEDVTERRRAEDRIVHLAHHDALTGMPNRLLFWQSAARALRRLDTSGHGFAVLYLDLDKFKEVNDVDGHPVGDRLLCAVAERLQAVVPAPHLVARLGGDEFAVLQLFAESSKSDPVRLAQAILGEVGRPYFLIGKQINIHTSIGIATAPKDGSTTEELMKNADLALYQAKGLGGGTYRCFDSESQTLLRPGGNPEVELRKALSTRRANC